MGLQFKRNTVRVSVLDYNLAIFGIQGVGKSTLAYEVCKKLAPEQYVIFNCGREDGIKTLNDAIYIDCPTWDDLEDAIDEIHDNRMSDEQFRNLKIVVLDTIDEIYAMAEKEVVRLSNKAGKKCTSVKGAFGGYGAGLDKTVDLVLDTLWKLKDVGINVFYIGHIKSKTTSDPVSEQEYQVLTANLSSKYFSAIATKMDVIGMCYVDRDIIIEKKQKKGFDGKEKTIEKGKVTSEARKICFRSDNFATESKSRFPKIVNEINMDADEFINAIEDAIRAQIADSGKSEDQLKKEQEEAAAIREKEIAEAEEKHKAKKELQSVIDDIKEFIKNNSDDKEKLKLIVAGAKKLGYDNPVEIDKLTDAKKILKLCK